MDILNSLGLGCSTTTYNYLPKLTTALLDNKQYVVSYHLCGCDFIDLIDY